MIDNIVIRPPLPADHLEIAALIQNLIPRYLSREVTPEGVAILRAQAQPGPVGARLNGIADPTWSPALVAATGSRVIGFGAVRGGTHITQLHVAEDWHGRGVGARLVRGLIEAVQQRHPAAETVTLGAVPGALTAYLRMGFVPVRPRWRWRGIVGQPMQIRVSNLIHRKAPRPAIRQKSRGR
ncbi:GNAT family N-acetyltransferase [Dongia sp.]|uniref:GNAT family N-acetyltransferase n=1 Tax=Dongia sp. TaxID=1977262 RepID=UPI0037529879